MLNRQSIGSAVDETVSIVQESLIQALGDDGDENEDAEASSSGKQVETSHDSDISAMIAERRSLKTSGMSPHFLQAGSGLQFYLQ